MKKEEFKALLEKYTEQIDADTMTGLIEGVLSAEDEPDISALTAELDELKGSLEAQIEAVRNEAKAEYQARLKELFFGLSTEEAVEALNDDVETVKEAPDISVAFDILRGD